MRALLCLLAVSLVFAGHAQAQDGPLVPPKRGVVLQDFDLPGGDIAQIFDTTLEACEKACITNERCTAYTFNSRNASCFPKAGEGAPEPYQGAISARIIQSPPSVEDRARAQRADLAFLTDDDFATARTQAETLGREHVTNPFTADQHLTDARAAEARGDVVTAMRFSGAALNLTDSGEGWADYARLLLLSAKGDSDNRSMYQQRAVQASVNAYLRSGPAALRHNVLLTMAAALEDVGRGSASVGALRLAQALQPRDDTAALLDIAAGKYGFRVVENDLQADSLRPRLCVTFSENLVASGVDYESFVQLAETGLTVTTDGPAPCVSRAWRMAHAM